MLNIIPTTDNEAQGLIRDIYKYNPRTMEKLLVSYQSCHKDETVQGAYVMALHDIIQDLDYELTWGDDD